jgi:hypothetical protein
MSIYGYNFYDPFPLWARMKYDVKLHVPIRLRPVLRRTIQQRYLDLSKPYYLNEEYLSRIFDLKKLEIARYVDIHAIQDPVLLNCALTAEIILTSRF